MTEDFSYGTSPAHRDLLQQVWRGVCQWMDRNAWAKMLFPKHQRGAIAHEATWIADQRAADHDTANANPIGWRITTARRYLLTEYGRGRRNRCLNGFGANQSPDREAGDGPDPADVAGSAEIQLLVRDEIARLPDQSREVVELLLQGVNYRSIADQLGLSYHDVRKAANAGLEILRHRLRGLA